MTRPVPLCDVAARAKREAAKDVRASGEKTIGADHVAVPGAFWKVIADPARGEAIAFVMPNRPVAKGDLSPYEVPVEAIDRAIGAALPVKGDVSATPPIWPADLAAWRNAHVAACRKEKR